MMLSNSKNMLKTISINIIFVLVSYIFWQCENTINSDKNDETPPELYNIDTVVIWNPKFNPYIIKQDVIVSNNGLLQINAGVEILLVPHSVLVCDPAGSYYRPPEFHVHNGSIRCKGTAKNKISFRDSSSMEISGLIYIFTEENSQIFEATIEGIELGWFTLWDKRNLTIKNSDIVTIETFSNEYSEIKSNQIDQLFVSGGKGIIQNNVIVRMLGLQSDSMVVTQNYIGNEENKYDVGIYCSHNSRAMLTNNMINNHEVGISLFFASPELHNNNIINNNYNFEITPLSSNPQFDTIDATNNWWGTSDSTEIANKILYQKSGDIYSGKTIKFVPFAKNPFNL